MNDNKVISFTFSNLLYESRNKKEIQLLYEIGCQVILISNNNPFDSSIPNYVRLIPIPSSENISKFKILKKWNILRKIIKKEKSKLVIAHDIWSLLIAWFANFFNTKKHKLIYNSHEFEIGKNTTKKRSKIKLFFIKKIERLLINKCDFSIMVNDTIASEVAKIYKLKKRPVVIRNIPDYQKINNNKVIQLKNDVLSKMNLQIDTKIVMYHGAIIQNRGIENIIKVVSEIEDIALVVMGFGKENYINELKQLTIVNKINNRVIFLDARYDETFWDYIAISDVGLILIPEVFKSYYYMLPNKLFENIQAEVPILGSDYPEIVNIVDNYGIGEYCNPFDNTKIKLKLNMMLNNESMIQSYKENIKKAKEILCWENEKIIYKNYLLNTLKIDSTKENV